MAMTVTFSHYTCKAQITRYRSGGGNAIQLVAAADDPENEIYAGEPIATASINLPIALESDEVIIKDYSENEGMVDALVAAGIIGKPLRYVSSGFIEAPVCKLLVPAS